MIRYRTDFNFPMQWDDFIPEDRSLPRFTIMTSDEYDDGMNGDEIGYDEKDNWHNVVVPELEITENAAKLIISSILGVDHVDVEFFHRRRSR